MLEALANMVCAGGHGEFVRPATESKRSAISFEIAIVTFAVLALLAAELILSSAIRGTNFAGGDGKFARPLFLQHISSVVSFISTISIPFRVSDRNCFRSTCG